MPSFKSSLSCSTSRFSFLRSTFVFSLVLGAIGVGSTTAKAVDSRPITNLWLYLYSNNGVTNDAIYHNVSTWADQKTLIGGPTPARNATAGTYAPTYETGQINGRPDINFPAPSGSSVAHPYMNVSGAAGNTATANTTIFVVAKNTGTVVEPILSTGSTNGWTLRYSAGTKLDYIHNTAAAPTTANTATVSVSSGFHILEMRRVAGTTIQLGVDARMGAAKVISNFTVASAATLIGKSGTTYLNGKLAEILIYDGVLSAADRKTAYGQLSSAYAIGLDNPNPTTSAVTAKVGATAVAAGGSISQPTGVVTFSVTATDDSRISKVEFYRGATLFATATTGTANVFTSSLTNLAVGSYSITAKAYDDLSGVTTSSAFAFTVTNPPPTISVITATQATSPFSSGVTLTQPTGLLTFKITATDNDGVSKVEFYNGATLLTTVTTPVGNVYSYSTSNLASGTLSITAKAYDGATPINAATSAAFNVTALDLQPEIGSVNGVAPSSLGALMIQTSSADTTLSLQAYDANQNTPDGEPLLIYTWSNPPTGAVYTQPTINGTNAARSMPIHFSAIGTYVFHVTVTDGEGKSVASDVTVKVNSLDTASLDTDGDGLSNADEINIYGTSPLDADTDHDGYNDSIDAYPLDRTRWLPPASDGTAPDMWISEPLNPPRV